MFVLGQRASISSISSTASRRLSSDEDDKIRINKLDVYYEDRIDLKNWLMQMNIYFTFYSILANEKTIFAFTFLKERA
jgi:hypothetical protein